ISYVAMPLMGKPHRNNAEHGILSISKVKTRCFSHRVMPAPLFRAGRVRYVRGSILVNAKCLRSARTIPSRATWKPVLGFRAAKSRRPEAPGTKPSILNLQLFGKFPGTLD